MPSRVIALLLALVLLWSGVSTTEAPRTDTLPFAEQLHANVVVGGQAAAPEGTVDEHHLDDLPAQAQSDPPAEPQDLRPEPVTARLQGGALDLPRAPGSVALAPPFLAGPLRPPCGTALAG